MKKIVLFVSMLFVTHFLYANSITIKNLTNCDFSYSFRGLEIPGNPATYFESPLITIPPGTITYNSPNDVPGLSVAATATFYFIKGLCTEPPVPGANPDASVGDPGWGVPTFVISSTNGYLPTCNGNSGFKITWVNSGTNIFVTIYP